MRQNVWYNNYRYNEYCVIMRYMEAVTLDKKPAKQRLVALVDAEQKEALGRLSEATGLSQGEIVRRWLAYAIEQSEHARVTA